MLGEVEDDATDLGDVAWNELVTADPAEASAFYARLSGSTVSEAPAASAERRQAPRLWGS